MPPPVPAPSRLQRSVVSQAFTAPSPPADTSMVPWGAPAASTVLTKAECERQKPSTMQASGQRERRTFSSRSPVASTHRHGRGEAEEEEEEEEREGGR